MQKLGLDVLDLFLIHWPLPMYDEYVETWEAFKEILASGRVKAIGVSNFKIPHLQRLIDETGTVPALNQVELHPWFPQTELREFHAQHGIVTESWSPIGQGKGLLDDPVVVRVAERVGRTPAQVVLRWHVQHDIVPIPKSVTPERIRSNIDVFDFELSDADIADLAGLASGRRIGPDPDTFAMR
jgi:diketogulonate reductase-like aldo/keto reductase